MTHTDPLTTARETYAIRCATAEAALQRRLDNLAQDNPAAARDINSPESRACYAPYYAVLKAARADFDAVARPIIRSLYAA